MKFRDVTTEHVSSLDGVRGLAIIFVLIHHFFYQVEIPFPVIRGLIASGWVGVDLFFVLSGFLITSILLKGKEKRERYFTNFYSRRILRIFPIYYLFLLGVFFLVYVGATNIDGTKPWYYFLYLQNFFMIDPESGRMLGGALGHTWSLAIEEQFYLVWPLLIFFLSQKSAVRVGIFLLLVIPLSRGIWALQGGFPYTVYLNFFARLDTLVMGSLLAIFVQRKTQSIDRFFWLFQFAVLFSALFVLMDFIYYGYLARHRFGYPFLYTAIALVSVWIVLSCVREDLSWPTRVFSSNFLKTFGKYSYSLYLIHPLVLLFFHHNLIDQENTLLYTLIFPLFLGLNLLISIFLWNVIESPILKLKRYFPR